MANCTKVVNLVKSSQAITNFQHMILDAWKGVRITEAALTGKNTSSEQLTTKYGCH